MNLDSQSGAWTANPVNLTYYCTGASAQRTGAHIGDTDLRKESVNKKEIVTSVPEKSDK